MRLIFYYLILIKLAILAHDVKIAVIIDELYIMELGDDKILKKLQTEDG